MMRAKNRPLTVLGFLGRTLLGAIIGHVLSTLLLCMCFAYWVATVYEPASRAGGDDGGAGEGWLFLLAYPVVVIPGTLLGMGLIHVIHLRLTKRTLESATVELAEDMSRISRLFTHPFRSTFSWAQNHWQRTKTKLRKRRPMKSLN